MSRRLPPARSYFFSHHSLWPEALKRQPHLTRTPCAVFFTHPRPLAIGELALGQALAKATMVLPMCTLHVEHLLRIGVPPERVTVAIPGTDFERFRSHSRGNGLVGLCSAFYERKAPAKILQVVSTAPSRDFLLVGRGWPDASEFPRLAASGNFRYVEASYADYPSLYDQMDVFLSLSELEGGPIPLLEAMASNAVPVATRTGFAPDLIRHGDNGFLCDIDSTAIEITRLIDQAANLQGDIRSTVESFTYDAFARLVHSALQN